MKASTLLFVLSCSLGSFSLEAHAQASASERALAAAYEADSLFARGKWAEAHDRFREADTLAHSPVFVLYMARAKRNAGELVAARTIYERVLSEKLPSDAPKPFRAALEDAAAELAEVKAKTPRVRLEVVGRPTDEVEVGIDGSPAVAGVSTPMDPGPHVFVARSAAKEIKKEASLEAGGGETVITLDFNESRMMRADPEKNEGSLIPGIIAFSVGGLGLGLGTVTGAIAATEASDIKDGCIENRCLEEDKDALDRANTLATVSTVSFIAGGACVVAGIVLVAVRPGGSDGSTTVSIGPMGMRLIGTF